MATNEPLASASGPWMVSYHSLNSASRPAGGSEKATKSIDGVTPGRSISRSAPSVAVQGVVSQVLGEIADQVADDEPIPETPVAVDLLERVVVPPGDHAL